MNDKERLHIASEALRGAWPHHALRTLVEIEGSPGVTASVLADKLGSTVDYAYSVLDAHLNAGLIARDKENGKGRFHCTLTPQGHALVAFIQSYSFPSVTKKEPSPMSHPAKVRLASHAFRAVADPERLIILLQVALKPGANARDLAADLGSSEVVISCSLTQLGGLGLLTGITEGRLMPGRYSLTDAGRAVVAVYRSFLEPIAPEAPALAGPDVSRNAYGFPPLVDVGAIDRETA